MANTFKFGNGEWAVGKETVLAYNSENNNFKPLPFSFDRASTATVVNKDGLIETVGTDEPRIDFLNNTKGHLLLEPQRRNIITNSEQFVDAPTGNTNMDLFSGTITNNNTTSPDGNTKGMKFTISSGSGAVLRIYQSDLSTSANTTFSIYAKKGTTDSLSINISGGTATTATLTDEWQRFSTTNTSSGSKFLDVEISGSAGEYIYIFGIQAEAGSYATSYIPTSGSAVTRSAETCNITGLEINAMNGATEGTLFLELEFEKESAGDAMQWRSSTSNAGRGFFYDTAMGFADTYGANGVTIYSLTQNSKLKAAFRLNSLSNATVFLNGTKGGTGNGNTWVNIGQLLLNSTYWKMKINEIKMYNTALSDSELQALTQV